MRPSGSGRKGDHMITVLAFTGVVCLWWQLLCWGWKASCGVLKLVIALFCAEAMIIGMLYVGAVIALLFSFDKWLFESVVGLFS